MKANPKSLGPKLGSRLKPAEAALARLDANEVARQLQTSGRIEVAIEGGPAELEAGDVFIQAHGPEGWSGVADRGTQVALDARITAELAREGLAREVVRHVQSLRKEANLELEDRIELYLRAGSPELEQAIQEHLQTIGSETLTIRWAPGPLGADASSEQVTVDGAALAIELRPVRTHS